MAMMMEEEMWELYVINGSHDVQVSTTIIREVGNLEAGQSIRTYTRRLIHSSHSSQFRNIKEKRKKKKRRKNNEREIEVGCSYV